MNQLSHWTPRLLLSRTTLGRRLFLALVTLLVAGYCTAQTPEVSMPVPPAPTKDVSVPVPPAPTKDVSVPVLPAPIRSFPPVKPGLIRLPVIVTFPKGGDIFQHIANLVKGGIKQVAQETVLKSRMRELWAKMESPLRMDKDLWLLIQPESLSVGMMRTDLKQASTLHAVLEMVASPEIRFGPKPLTTPVEMPPLGPFQPGPGIFQAMANTHINYEDANRYFRDPRMKIIGKVLPGTGERKLTIEGIRLYGSGGKIIVEAKLHYNPPVISLSDQPAKLTLYLRGTPRYLSNRRVFDMPDLEYDIKSNDLILELADFILKSGFKNELRRVAIIPVGSKLDKLKLKMLRHLNKPLGHNAHITTQINSFEVLDGYADNEGLEVRATLMGAATLEYTWK